MRKDGPVVTSVDNCFMGSESLDDQVGFYSQPRQPHIGDVNSRVGVDISPADTRFNDQVTINNQSDNRA